MSNPSAYSDSDKYIIMNPNNPKVGHLIFDAPIIDTNTKEYIKDTNGKIKVFRTIVWGVKGLTNEQVNSVVNSAATILDNKITLTNSNLTDLATEVHTVVDSTTHQPIMATTGSVGVVQLANETDILNGATGKIVDAAQLKTLKEAVASELANGVHYRGTVAEFSDLPASPSMGDMYNVTNDFTVNNKIYPAGTNVVADVSSGSVTWDVLDGDPSGYAKLGGNNAFTGNNNFTNSTVTVAAPISNSNPTTKKYVDDALTDLAEEISNSTNIAVVSEKPATQANNTAFAYPSANKLNPIALAIGPSALWTYSESKDYASGSVVLHNNRLYICVQANGVSSVIVEPGTDATRWLMIPTELELSRNIDELVYSISPLTDSSLHLADGQVISGVGAYHQYYAKKLADYNNADIVANARQVGTLTSDNGVYSGFSNSSYLRSAVPFNPLTNTWTFNIKFTTGSDVNTWQSIINSHRFLSIAFLIRENHFGFWASSDGRTWNIIENAQGSYTVLPNTTYYIRLSYNGSAYNVSYSLDGSNYISDINISSSTNVSGSLLQFGYNPSQYFFGSIDFNETSIYLGGTASNNLWWQGAVKKGFTNSAYYSAYIAVYGSCGKFVIDTVNETIRLPKLTGFLEGTVNLRALSELKEAGLPDIQSGSTGINSGAANGGTWGAIIQQSDHTSGSVSATGNTYVRYYDILKASAYNPIYGNSPTVQVQSISVYVYIVIANAQKTSIAVDIDKVMTDVNNLGSNKANKDFSNVTDVAKVMMAKASMPSTRYIDLTLGATGTWYTAPADGYFCLVGAPAIAAACEISLTNITASLFSTAQNTVAWGLRIYIPCSKNDIVCVGYSVIFRVSLFKFIYAQGAVSEA